MEFFLNRVLLGHAKAGYNQKLFAKIQSFREDSPMNAIISNIFNAVATAHHHHHLRWRCFCAFAK
jgi:hypothetical protein